MFHTLFNLQGTRPSSGSLITLAHFLSLVKTFFIFSQRFFLVPSSFSGPLASASLYYHPCTYFVNTFFDFFKLFFAFFRLSQRFVPVSTISCGVMFTNSTIWPLCTQIPDAAWPAAHLLYRQISFILQYTIHYKLDRREPCLSGFPIPSRPGALWRGRTYSL